jgi:type IX secretion system PorP/SprF family membrane protein
MRYSIWKIAISILFCQSVIAQDIHYSIWDMSPMNLNPAMTGQFDGDYRFDGNHRSQWKSVTTPYSTFSFSGDSKRIFKKKNLSGGIQINQDRAGDSRLNTFQLNGSVALLLPLSADSMQNISFGVQTGLTNRNLTYDPLQFDVQYDGFQYDPNLSNQETFARASRTYLNLNSGIGYFNKIDTRKIISGGIGFFNLSAPKQSYFNDDNIRLDVRIAIHGNAEWKVAEKWDVIPSFIFSSQGKFKELNFGGAGRYVITDFIGMYRAAWIGAYYRNKDAVFFTLGFNYDAWKVGINYDLNTSSLRPASNGRGGFEIAIEYIIKLAKPSRVMHRICPDYL